MFNELSLDRQSAVPLTDQIEAQMRALIQKKHPPAGTRLPSIRSLAQRLGVSANTVVAAYDRLAAQALIESRSTAGFVISQASHAGESVVEIGDIGEEQEPLWLAEHAHNLRPDLLTASSGALPPSWLADAVPVTAVQRALASHPQALAARCPPQGLPELRERIALLMQGQGMPVSAGQIMTTYGGTHAIDLICQAWLKPGDTVLVEDPGYFLLFARLREAGLRVIPIRRNPDGPDIAQVERACRDERPKIFFVQTVIHNPTGWTSTASNLHRLLGVADRHGLLLAEDDVHGHFHPGHAPRLAELSALHNVIYYSSFSKALSPALRLGYVAAQPQQLRPLLAQKIFSVLSSPALNEYVLLELLATGRFRKHLDRLQQKLQGARSVTRRELAKTGIRFDHADTVGLFLWGELPRTVDVTALAKDAYQNGILLSRGGAFTVANTPSDPHIRFNVVFAQNARLHSYLDRQLAPARASADVLAKLAKA